MEPENNLLAGNLDASGLDGYAVVAIASDSDTKRTAGCIPLGAVKTLVT